MATSRAVAGILPSRRKKRNDMNKITREALTVVLSIIGVAIIVLWHVIVGGCQRTSSMRPWRGDPPFGPPSWTNKVGP